MLALAAERAWGAHPLGMPVEHTRDARRILGPDALLAVTQFVILDPSRSRSADLARAHVAAAMPNRRSLLHGLGYESAASFEPRGPLESLDDRLVEALVVTGDTDDVAQRVREHLNVGADHVSLHVLTDTPQHPPLRQWSELASLSL